MILSAGISHKPRPKSVVVIDRFTGDGTEAQTHGEKVLEELHLQGFQGDEFAPVDTTAGFAPLDRWIRSNLEQPQAGFFQQYIEGFAVSVLQNTNAILEDVIEAKELGVDIGVVSQSQGVSAASLTQQVLMKGGTPLGDALVKTMPKPEQPQSMAKVVSSQVQEILRGSEELALQVATHGQLVGQLAELGISYGVAAGNTGRMMKMLEQQGVDTPDDFETNLLAKANDAVVVGGFDDKGTTDRTDDQLWVGSSQFAEVDILASHRNLRGGGGTSYSLPKVMGALEQLRREEPGMTPEQRLQTLRERSATVANSDIPAHYS